MAELLILKEEERNFAIQSTGVRLGVLQAAGETRRVTTVAMVATGTTRDPRCSTKKLSAEDTFCALALAIRVALALGFVLP